MMGAPGLNLDGVTKRFGEFVLGPVSLHLAPGRSYGLLGPNGAGKTTLLNLIALQIKAGAGAMTWNGQPIAWGDTSWKARLSYIREVPAFYDEFTVAETLAFTSRVYERWDAPLAVALVKRFGLDPRRRVGQLSKGTKVKVGLVAALAHRAEVLLLDEPTAGLDPTSRADLQGTVRALMEESPSLAVLLSSHIFEDLEATSDEVVILRDGAIALRASRTDPGGLHDLAAVYHRAVRR